MLPADYARCPGERVGDGWLSDCETCARRTSPPPNPNRVLMMEPPEDVLARLSGANVQSVRTRKLCFSEHWTHSQYCNRYIVAV